MLYFFGIILILNAGVLLLPTPVALIYSEFSMLPIFLIPAGISALVGLFFWQKFESEELGYGQSMILVSIAWLVFSFSGAIPFTLGINLGILEAFFESVAGFTATGLTVVQGAQGWLVEVPPQSILFWRSVTQWVGGVGVIVLFLAIIGRSGKFSRLLYESEARQERILPRIQDTAKFLWKVYGLFTLLGAIGFILTGMDPFAAINHSMTGIATGGFSVTADSFAGFGTPILIVAMIIMVFGAISFVTHRRLFEKDWKALIESSEVKLMIILISLATLGLFWKVGLTNALFESISALTGTGFSTTGLIPEAWGAFEKGVLTLLMVTGGGYGSTSSAIKLIRTIIILGTVLWIIKRAFLPDRAVVPLSIDGEIRKEKDVMEAATYAFLYIIFLVISSLLIMLLMPGQTGIDVVFESASAQGNVGLSVGITEIAQPSVRIILIIQMLAGRLEILPYIALLYSIYRKIPLIHRDKSF